MEIRHTTFQMQACRDAVARGVYVRLWEWVVKELNKAIIGGGERKEGTTMSIGVLDIFGFECFKRNGFEQLCINYTNERLQKQFNSFVFEEEQRLYAAEGIRWDDVEWRDNSGTLEAIGGREGILRTLDDECRLPKGSDMKFVGRLHKLCVRGRSAWL